MLAADKPPLDEVVLSHFGTKGMHWGVRNEDKLSGQKVSSKKDTNKAHNPYALTDDDRAVLKGAGVDVSASESMHDKYGPGSLSKKPEKPPGKLSQEQKDALQGLLIAGGIAAGAWYLYHRANKVLQDDYFRQINPVERVAGPKRNLEPFRKEWMNYVATVGGRERGYTKDIVNGLSDEPVHLGAGTIFKRISTQQEVHIRPQGFYASHKEEDVNRYKAMLPIYWKLWGKSNTSGYVVNLKANADVKAPSPKKTYEMFRGMLNDKVGDPHLGGTRLRDLFAGGNHIDDDEAARKIFPQFAGAWAKDEHPATKHFFAKLKGEGYNAVVDMNDAGALASKPLRLLDGDMFSIDSHDRLSANAIATAQENIKAVIHAVMTVLNSYALVGEDYLVHAGIKGMKWGHRKAVEPADPAARHERNKQIVKAAIAVGIVAVGAILLKRGGYKLSSPASRKIIVSGAKVSGKILTTTARGITKTSTKLGQTVGKTAAKGTIKVGKLAGKGAYKGAIAGSKAAGRAVAQNGSKFYERGIKKTALATVKLGSHAMYKFTGRGTPIVKDVAKKSINLSPTDLLLNVRADKWRGR